MAIDFAGLGQNMVEDGLPVILDLNWGFETDTDLPCQLYLKEFHLVPELLNCAEVPGTSFKGTKIHGLEVKRSGTVWVCSANDGYHLDGKCPDLEQLFVVKQTADADGLPIVKVTGVCPGPNGIGVVWPENDDSLDTQQKAVIERFVAKCQEGKKKGPIDLGWVSVELVERKR